MTKPFYSLYIVVCAALLGGACTSAPKSYTLNGVIDGATTFALIGCGDQNVATADTIFCTEDGSFTYSKLIDEPSVGFIYVPDCAFYPLIMVGGTTTELTASIDMQKGATFSGDLAEAQRVYTESLPLLHTACEEEYATFAEMQAALHSMTLSIKKGAKAVSPKAFSKLLMGQVNGQVEYTLMNYSQLLNERGVAADSDMDYNR